VEQFTSPRTFTVQPLVAASMLSTEHQEFGLVESTEHHPPLLCAEHHAPVAVPVPDPAEQLLEPVLFVVEHVPWPEGLLDVEQTPPVDPWSPAEQPLLLPVDVTLQVSCEFEVLVVEQPPAFWPPPVFPSVEQFEPEVVAPLTEQLEVEVAPGALDVEHAPPPLVEFPCPAEHCAFWPPFTEQLEPPCD
jgi:hypothetical protein